MGFAEADCLSAITFCGLDVDKAISWLCDNKPQITIPSEPKKLTPIIPQESEAVRAQKEKEKEAQRRIHREWNAKVPHQRVEEERKKVNIYLPICLHHRRLKLIS